MKENRLKVYDAPASEELNVSQMYGICQESPAPGAIEKISEYDIDLG